MACGAPLLPRRCADADDGAVDHRVLGTGIFRQASSTFLQTPERLQALEQRHHLSASMLIQPVRGAFQAVLAMELVLQLAGADSLMPALAVMVGRPSAGNERANGLMLACSCSPLASLLGASGAGRMPFERVSRGLMQKSAATPSCKGDYSSLHVATSVRQW